MGDSFDPAELDRRRFLQAVGGASATAAVPGSATAADDGGDSGAADDRDRVIVGISGDRDVEAVVDRIEQGTAGAIPSDAEVVSVNPTLRHAVLAVPAGAGLTQSSLVAAAESHEAIRYAERDDPVYDVPASVAETGASAQSAAEPSLGVTATPSDPLFDEQYAPQQVNAPKAWEQVQNGEGVTIAVIDQGVKYDHPDLQNRFDQVLGRDFVDRDDDPMPETLSEEYHGTHVAGIAAATTDNGAGVSGISDATLLSCRVLSPDGGRPSAIADAIQWAADEGADIINMSLGGPSASPTMRSAIDYAFRNGTLPIAAMGNSGKEEEMYPAGYDNCVAVSAVDESESLARFSTTGSHVDVAGPGVDVLSTWTESGGRAGDYPGKYAAISGTSMATPAVAGVAALGKAAYPDLSPADLRAKLKNTAVDIGLDDTEQGAGRADALKLVGAACEDDQAPTAGFTTDITDPHVGETVVFESQSSDECGYVEGWEWDFGDGTTATGKSVRHAFDDTGEQTVTLTVTDDESETSTTERTLTVQAGGPGEKEHTETFQGSIDQPGGRSKHTYSFRFDPSSLEVTIDTAEEFVWGLRHDGEVFTPSGDSDTITVRDYELDPAKDVTLVVVSPDGNGSPTGDYSVGLTEYGFGDGEADNEPPTAALSASTTTPGVDEQVTFDASASSDPDGAIETYAWTFGDGTQRTGEVVTHSYGTADTYTVELTVTDDGGKRDRTTETVQVTGGADPSPAFSLDSATVDVGEAVTVDPSASTDPDGSIDQYAWDWGDGTTAERGGPERLTHAYDAAGEYDVVLTVTDDDGNTASTARTVTVEPGDGRREEAESGSLSGWWDSATYTVTSSWSNPETLTVSLEGPAEADFDLFLTTDGSTPTWYNYDRKSTSPDSSETIELTEGVTADSEYGVLITAAQGSGEYTLSVTSTGSSNEGPTADAAADDTDVQVGETVTFDAASSTDPDGSIAAYEWAFGDGTTATGATVQHAYDEPDTYTARLTVRDDDGATATDTIAMTVAADSGGERETTTETGSLSGTWGRDRWTYEPATASPSQLSVELSGPADADFDLFVAVGYDARIYRYDRKSTTPGSDESILLEAFDADDEVSILVHSYRGGGEYELSLTEVGT